MQTVGFARRGTDVRGDSRGKREREVQRPLSLIKVANKNKGFSGPTDIQTREYSPANFAHLDNLR